MLSPPLVALVGRVFGLKAYPVLLAVLYGVMIVSLLLFSKQMKKQGRYDTKL